MSERHEMLGKLCVGSKTWHNLRTETDYSAESLYRFVCSGMDDGVIIAAFKTGLSSGELESVWDAMKRIELRDRIDAGSESLNRTLNKMKEWPE